MNRILIIVVLGFGTINMINVFLFPVRLLQMLIALQQFHKFLMPFFFLKGRIEKKGERKNSLANSHLVIKVFFEIK